MEGSSKHSKNDGLRRSQSKTVVYKNNLSTTFNKKSLRANNRALARALTKKKQEVSNLQSDYVKLLNQNNLLRLHLQGHDAEISKFYADKFAQFRTTVSDAAKLLHSVCGQLIDISSNFENMSEFFKNLQSITLSKPTTTTSQNVTTVRRPAQRVAVTQEETVNESEDEKMEDDEEKPAETRRYLDIIAEEPSRIDDTLDQNFASAVFDEDLDEKDVENGLDLDNSHILSFNLTPSLSSKVGDVSQKLSFPINDDVKTSVNSSILETELFQQEDFQKNDNDFFAKNKIALSRQKSRGSKPGQVKYNASKSDNPSKSRFKSFAGSQKSVEENEKVEVPTSGGGDSESNKIGADKLNAKDKQTSVYDLSLDDSSYIAPPTLHKAQIPQDHYAPSVVLERIDAECSSAKVDDDNHNAKESHGIMLRLGNGARTKPKDKTKNVRYNEDAKSDINEASKSKVIENGEVLSENSQKTSQPKSEKAKDPSNLPDVLKKTSKNMPGDADETPASVSNVQKVREDVDDEDVNEEAEVKENIQTKTSKDDKVDLPERSSIESRSSSDGNSRKRRAAASVNYKEPSLNLKMRNPHSSAKKGKKSTS